MHKFDKEIAITRETDQSFKVAITDNWSINGTPNGGYLMALMANAMVQSTENIGNLIITANFISRSQPGNAEIHVERIAQSNQFERLQARLIQEGRERARAFGTFSSNGDDTSQKRYERSEPHIAELSECVAMPEIPNYTLYSQIDVRLDPSCTGWMAGSESEKSEIKGWTKFREDRPIDLFAAILMSDSFPPAVLASHGVLTWVPTIEFSVNIRNVPPTKCLKCAFRTFFINNGMFEEDGEMWDEEGNLVGISRQYAQIRTSST